MLIVLAYVLRMPALQGRLGVSLRAIYELFWPTADLWLPLIDEPIDVAKAGAAISRELKIQYPGYYTLGLRVAKRVPNPVPTPQSKPTLRVSFTQNGKEVKGFDIGPQLQSPWWRAEEWGFEMARRLYGFRSFPPRDPDAPNTLLLRTGREREDKSTDSAVGPPQSKTLGGLSGNIDD